MTSHANGAKPAASSGAALYVDTENLRDAESARQVVASVVADWPDNRPPLLSLSLYVRADKVELWRLWAEDAFSGLRHRVRGVQHFSANNSKNSADLAITADAVADLASGSANDVAVVSNDSDFAALFVKVRELALEANADSVPFLWITVPGGGSLSAEIAEFIPATYRWDLTSSPPASAAKDSPPASKSLPAAPRTSQDANVPGPGSETIAEELIRRLPVGKFRVAEAHAIFRDQWPAHPAATGPAQLGTFLLKEIWPILKQRGVAMVKEKSPRTYEITQAAKDTVAIQPVDPAIPLKPLTEEQLTQLAATIATGITDDLFKASDAQAALKSGRPQHPAASYTAAQFGIWFARQLWPIMERCGVILANEKPRRYEMTPDARHRLMELA